MFRVSFPVAAHVRLRPAAIVLMAVSSMIMPADVLAQSSVGVPANAATGRSLTDAVDQIGKELIDREVLGAAPTGSPTAGGAAIGISAFPTGRLRTSDHDGRRPRSDASYSNETNEGSAFANVVVAVPGTMLGGQLKLAGFVGHNLLSLDLKSNAVAVLDPAQFAKADNSATLAGATALWASGGFYTLASIVGMWGETRLVDGVDDCFEGGCNVNRYKFDTTGFIGTVIAGKVFDLTGASGPKLDVRGSIGHTRNTADPFVNINNGNPAAPEDNGGHIQKYKFSTWNGTAAATLFANLSMPNDAMLRPYIQGSVRQEWHYRNVIEATSPEGILTRTAFDQRHLYGGVDVGLTYTQGNMTLGSSVYFEGSGDERSIGARLRASWQLN